MGNDLSEIVCHDYPFPSGVLSGSLLHTKGLYAFSAFILHIYIYNTMHAYIYIHTYKYIIHTQNNTVLKK